MSENANLVGQRLFIILPRRGPATFLKRDDTYSVYRLASVIPDVGLPSFPASQQQALCFRAHQKILFPDSLPEAFLAAKICESADQSCLLGLWLS